MLNIFSTCNGLTSIVVESGNPVYDSRNNCNAIIETATNTLIVGCKKTTIPNSVTKIGSSAFYYCVNLTAITIPNSVTAIEDYAFYGCFSITAITIPNSVTTIGSNVFKGCEIVICMRETPPTAKSDTFTENITAIVPNASISKYQQATGWKNCQFNNSCYLGQTTQTTITLCTTNIFSNVKAILNGVTYIPQNDSIKITGLEPNTTYKISLSGNYGDMQLEKIMSVTTKDIYLGIQLIERTNLTLKLKGYVSDSGDALITNSGFEGHEGQNELYVDGLAPGKTYTYTYFVLTSNGKKFTKSDSFKTTPIELNVNVNIGSSSAQLMGRYSIDDATIINYGFEGYPNQTDIKLIGLDPNYTYTKTFFVETKEGGIYTEQKSFTTTDFCFITSHPKVISSGNVIVAAETNIDDDETNIGFEWRRTDWTDDFASNSGVAYLYEGTMEGYIRNLNTEKLWKYRPYYTSNAGNTYYGEWVGIDPTNTSYFEPTVHTYANVSVNGNSAEVKGYVQRGTDNVVSKGFAYWEQTQGVKSREAMAAPSMISSLPSNAKTIEVSGSQQVMTASLSNLEYETTYCYVSFVRTSEGDIFYGEEQSFITGEDPLGIGGIMVDASDSLPVKIVARYNMNGQQITSRQPGVNILRMSDGSVKKVMVK